MNLEQLIKYPNFLQIYLENDEMHDFHGDMTLATSYNNSPLPSTYIFMMDNWKVGKAFGCRISIPFLSEVVEYLENNPKRHGDFTTTTQLIIMMYKHATKRLKQIEFDEEILSTI
jgi:hypothetical protein